MTSAAAESSVATARSLSVARAKRLVLPALCRPPSRRAAPREDISRHSRREYVCNLFSSRPHQDCIHADALLTREAALEGALGGQPCTLPNPPSAGDVSNTSLDMGAIPDFTDLGDMSGMGLSHLAWPLEMSGEGDPLPGPRPISYNENDILSTLEGPDSWSAVIQDAIQPGSIPRPAKNLKSRADITARPYSNPQTPANTDESSSPGCSPEAVIPSLVQSDL